MPTITCIRYNLLTHETAVSLLFSCEILYLQAYKCSILGHLHKTGHNKRLVLSTTTDFTAYQLKVTATIGIILYLSH